jgi:type IV secretion system protein VirD4
MELVFVFVIFGIIAAIGAENKARQKRITEAYKFNPANSHGNAQFVTDNGTLKKRGLFSGKGVPIGYSPDGRHEMHYSGFGHLLTVATARTGKGATLIVNALLSVKTSCIIVCPKAENTVITSHFRRRFGKVFVLNPFKMFADKLGGVKLARFNPMDIIDAAALSFHADCDKLAAALVWEEGREGIHFTTAARILVSGVIAALVRHGAAREKNLATVARVISGDVYQFCRDSMQSKDPFILQKLARFAAAGAETVREIGDVVSTAITQLGFIGNAAIANSLAGSDFRFSDLKCVFRRR